MKSDERAEYYADLSRELLAQQDEPLTLQRIVELATEVVPGCDWAGISLRTDSSLAEPVASTDRVVHRADELQSTLQEGPCRDSAQDNHINIITDTRTDQRWPRWSPRVAELGIRSVLSVQLVSPEGELLGALNLYAQDTHRFSRNDLDEANVFAAHAGGAIGISREVSGLREALRSRHLIGVAQGMLIQRYDLTVDQAFAVLARHSQESNIKLRDVAAQIVEGGRLLGHVESRMPDDDGSLVAGQVGH